MKDIDISALSEIEELIRGKRFSEAALRLKECEPSKFEDSALPHFHLLTAEVGLYCGENEFSEILSVATEFYRIFVPHPTDGILTFRLMN